MAICRADAGSVVGEVGDRDSRAGFACVQPVSALLEDVGSMFVLTGKTLVSAIRPPYPYGNEFV